MSDTLLVAETGRETGSAASRRLRATDKIPAVLYGLGLEPTPIAVDRRELRNALSGPSGMNTILDLSVNGEVRPAIIKEIERHPVRRTVNHVDFIAIDLSKEITVSVPVRLVGIAVEVNQNNAMVDPSVDSLEVVTTPRSIPDEIVIDISDMTLDSVVRVADLDLPEGVTATADPEQAVVSVITLRVEQEPVAGETDADESGEGEGTETTPGDAAGGDSGESADAAE
jgi:large subunit ribosomal protein L25